jgi:hypothetical protein
MGQQLTPVRVNELAKRLLIASTRALQPCLFERCPAHAPQNAIFDWSCSRGVPFLAVVVST